MNMSGVTDVNKNTDNYFPFNSLFASISNSIPKNNDWIPIRVQKRIARELMGVIEASKVHLIISRIIRGTSRRRRNIPNA